MSDTSQFTPRAQQVLMLAQKEAYRLRHEIVRPEHMLVGFVRLGQGVAADALKKSNVSLEGLRSEIEKILPPGSYPGLVETRPYSPEIKSAITIARQGSQRLNHTYIGTEHLLLGLLDADDSPASTILKKLGADRERICADILSELDPDNNRQSHLVEQMKKLTFRMMAGKAMLDACMTKGPVDSAYALLLVSGEGLSEDTQTIVRRAQIELLKEIQSMKDVPNPEEALALQDLLIRGIIPTTKSGELIEAAALTFGKLFDADVSDLQLMAQAIFEKTAPGSLKENNWGVVVRVLTGKPATKIAAREKSQKE